MKKRYKLTVFYDALTHTYTKEYFYTFKISALISAYLHRVIDFNDSKIEKI